MAATFGDIRVKAHVTCEHAPAEVKPYRVRIEAEKTIPGVAPVLIDYTEDEARRIVRSDWINSGADAHYPIPADGDRFLIALQCVVAERIQRLSQ